MCESQRELSCYFPFLEKSVAYLTKRGFVLEATLEDKTLIERAMAKLRMAIAREPFNVRLCLDRAEEEAAAARLALYIAAATGNIYILRRFADYESKNFVDLLRKIPSIQDDRCKIEIAKDLGVDTKLTHEITPGVISAFYRIAVRWTAYLKYAPQDPYWAMINRPVIRGWVAMPVDDFERLLEEAYEQRILQLPRENELAVGKVAMSIDLSPLRDLIKHKPLQVKTPTAGPDPPCMTAILNTLKAGENLPHAARFAIVTYLLRRGWDVEQIVDLFRTVPDFNEKITRYQVQHIAGQAGGRKEYSVPSCETLKSWGLCVANCGVKNPMHYVKRGH
ncbi:MAG: DNA primase large subunit PriL [Pyrobaculum sp.]